MIQVSGKKILLVDDEIDLLDFFSMVLSTHGYQVLSASDGHAALEVVRRFDPDLILTDLKMPKLGGIEFVVILREMRIYAPVVLITGFGDVENRRRAAQLGVVDIMDKPLRSADLLKRIETVFEQRASGLTSVAVTSS